MTHQIKDTFQYFTTDFGSIHDPFIRNKTMEFYYVHINTTITFYSYYHLKRFSLSFNLFMHL